MSSDAWVTVAVVVVMFAVFIRGALPTSVVMGAGVGALLLVGVIDQQQALSGLSSSAPVTIAALYVLAGAATVTGAMSSLIDRVLDGTRGHRGSERGRLARLTASTAAMSAILPNTPLVALVAPRVVTWARRAGVSPSTYLMPLSFAAVLGGVITVIGTSTNLVVSDLLVASGGEPLGVFEITAVGLPLAVVGVGLLVALSPMLLRSVASSDELPERVQRYTVAMRVAPDGPLVGRSVEDAGLRHLHGVFLAGLERHDQVVTVRPETVLGAGDTCYFVGDVSDVVDLFDIAGLVTAEHPHLAGTGDRPDAGLFEVVISERSDLAGSTLRDVGFRSRYDAAVLAIRRHAQPVPGKLGAAALRGGDVLLVLAPRGFEQRWRASSEFSVVAPLAAAPPARRQRGWLVIVAIVGMIGLTMTEVLPLMESALVAAGLLVALRVISLSEARRSVNLNVVLTMAMAIGLGAAVSASGLAAELATQLTALGDPFGDAGLIVAVLASTMVLTELLSNNAAAALMFPVAVATALETGLDPRVLAVVVLIGASCSFLSPIGYQTNLMVFSLGGYRFADFTRLGAPLTIATLVVTPLVLPLVMDLR